LLCSYRSGWPIAYRLIVGQRAAKHDGARERHQLSSIVVGVGSTDVVFELLLAAPVSNGDGAAVAGGTSTRSLFVYTLVGGLSDFFLSSADCSCFVLVLSSSAFLAAPSDCEAIRAACRARRDKGVDHATYAVRQQVLIHLAFNMGVRGMLAMMRLVSAIESHFWRTAADEMLISQWAKQEPRRASVLAAMIRTGGDEVLRVIQPRSA
jgi:hypothetical protein